MKIEHLPAELRRAYVRYGYTLFLDAADEIDRLRGLVKTDDVVPVFLRMRLVCEVIEREFGLEPGDIRKRTRNVSKPRQIAMHIMHVAGNHNKSAIAKEFRLNHATVIHGLRSVADWISIDDKFRGAVERLTAICLREAKRERKVNTEKMNVGQ